MNARHRVLIVGVGSIGQRHLRCFQATGRAELSLCETNDALRGQIAAQYGIARAFSNLDAALAEPPEAAVIATPAPLHISMAAKMADAGAHLLIEKPLGTGLDGIEALQELVARKRLTAAVAYVLRMHPVLREMREAIHSGRFGRPLHVVAQCGQHFPTYRPAYRDIYYKDRAAGGGAIQDAMTHILNAGEWLAGPIDSLVADAAHQALEGVDVEDAVDVLTRQGDVFGCYSLNQHQAPNETVITVACQGGTCRYEAHNVRWRWMTSPGNDWIDQQHEPFERDALFVAQAQAFLDAIEGRGRPPCSLDEGLHTLRCNLAALASLGQAGWQQV